MECINKINGPELPKKNMEITSMCYLDDSGLIAVGTNIGHIFFWDLSKSQYLPLTYEKALRHKGNVTDMMTYISYGKENDDKVECMLSCSVDGIILLWEITKTEIKQSNKKYNYEEIEDMIIKKENEMKENDSNPNSKNISKSIPDKLQKDLNQNQQSSNKQNSQKFVKKSYQELKNYKCSPTIKRNIRSPNLEFNSIGFMPKIDKTTIYTGANDYYLYAWNFTKEGHIKTKTKNKKITRIIFDQHFLILAGDCGWIQIWNTPLQDDDEPVKELKDLDNKNSQNLIRINDILMLKKIGLLVSCDSNKKILFWKYQEEKKKNKEEDSKNGEIKPKHSIQKDNEITCLACDESYGKLLCGTKEKIIMEIDIMEELKSVKLENNYERYGFLKNPENYKEDEIDKKIDNFKIMKSLTQGVGQ